MAIKHLGSGYFIDTDPIEPPKGVSAPAEGRIYAYASFRSLEHVSYGLTLRTDPDQPEIDSIEVGEYGMEPVSQYQEFRDALHEIERGSKHAFEEVPYVEITSEDEYNEALDALEIEEGEGDLFDGPGLYDFRDSPPTYQGTVEENELTDLEHAADEALDFMFQGEEWEESYADLAEEEG